MFLGYRAEVCWWESVPLFSKVLLSVVAVAFWADPKLQVQLGLCVISSAQWLHIRLYPYENATMNHFQTFSLAITFFTFFFGSLSLIDGFQGHASGLALATNILYILVATVIIVRTLACCNKKKKVAPYAQAGYSETPSVAKSQDSETNTDYEGGPLFKKSHHSDTHESSAATVSPLSEPAEQLYLQDVN